MTMWLEDPEAEIEELRESLALATLELSLLRDELERDWLTGLYNRRLVANEFERNRKIWYGAPLAVAVVDVDLFKEINDNHGHGAGDRVLTRLATVMSCAVRASDIVVRVGGEEFLLLMPRTELTAATIVSERIRRTIETQRWDHIAKRLNVTASVGVAVTPALTDFDELVSVADANLYAAKRAGRNRVIT